MDIVGSRRYVEIAGDRTHELPPLLVRSMEARLDQVVDLAAELLDEAPDSEQGRVDLAINLAEQYKALVAQWRWGDSILEWIRQCETTFEARPELKFLLRPDVWPHAGRSSFVLLLEDKRAPQAGVDVEKAVGLRLTFRQPPPMSCCSDQFLFYLQPSLAETAYQKWSAMSPPPIASLPPERFHFDVVEM
jgi:hypothetical protein